MVEAQYVYQLARFNAMDDINNPAEVPAVEPVVETPAEETAAPSEEAAA